MTARIVVQPIGHVRGGRREVVDDAWGAAASRIQLDATLLDDDAALGLDQFSHIDVVYVFDRVDAAKVCVGSRHPKGRTDWPCVGILAQRAKDRPNRLGVTTCSLVDVDGLDIWVHGLDAVDGTPIVDVKPHMVGFEARGPVTEPAWATELMDGYW